jgi:hypothetical protein
VFNSRTSLDSFALSSTPDSVQGYGEVNLLSAVPASSDDMKAQDLFVLDAFQVAGKTNYLLQLEVAHSDKPLKVTIAWYDPPSGISTASNLLSRNLNLYVRHVATQTKWYGNNAQYGAMDAQNPQERVLIATPLTGKYEVYVSSPTSAYVTSAAVVITCHGGVTSGFSVYTGQLSEVLAPAAALEEVGESVSVSSPTDADTLPSLEADAVSSLDSFLPEMPFS